MSLQRILIALAAAIASIAISACVIQGIFTVGEGMLVAGFTVIMGSTILGIDGGGGGSGGGDGGSSGDGGCGGDGGGGE